VAGGGGTDLMLWFQLQRGGDEMKYCQKIKRKQPSHLGYMGRKCDMMCQRRPEERWH
jgi:hypothetical protein